MKKLTYLILALLLASSPLASAYYFPDGFDADSDSMDFEGATADDYETTIAVTDPTADRTITIPNATGTVSLVNSDETSTGTKTIATLNVSGNQTNTGTLTVKGTSALQGAVTVSSGTLTATIVTASLNASSGTVVRFPIVASTARPASGATAGSMVILNDSNVSVNCGNVGTGGTSIAVCVSDGTNWVLV